MKCNLKNGKCINLRNIVCDGVIYSGLCPGANHIKCCVPNTSYNSPLNNDNLLNLSCLEKPGGGRITNNTELKDIDSVKVQAPDVSLSSVLLHKNTASSYLNMISKARKDGIKAPLLGIVSGYRSDARQKILWDAKLSKVKASYPTWSQDQLERETRKWVAKPGYSNHRSGRTVDLVILGTGGDISSSRVNDMRNSDCWKWLNLNASLFGFYPYSVEPWHWEYNPKCESS